MQYLVSIPNVSAPEFPCLPNQTSIHDSATGDWLCYYDDVPCPPGTSLYFAVGPPSWKFCTPDIAYAEALHGPNAAPPVAVPAPALSSWALLAVFVLLALAGACRVPR
jgi:hypothetical protein